MPEALFDEAVISEEFARGQRIERLVFLIDEHSKIPPGIYTCLEKICESSARLFVHTHHYIFYFHILVYLQ